MASAKRADTIHISKFSLHLPDGAGPSAFGLEPPPPCLALASLEIQVNDAVIPSCTADDTFGGLGINYSGISKAIIALIGSRSWNSPEDLLKGIASVPLGLAVVTSISIQLELPKASLLAESIIYSAKFEPNHTEGTGWGCRINNMRIRTVVGLHPYEQTKKQPLEFDIAVQSYQGSYQPRLLAEQAYEVRKFTL